MIKITPYNNTSTKKEQVTAMYERIAKSNDLLNHLLSLGMDCIWRKMSICKLHNIPKTILDVATGTGDFAVTAAKYTQAQITGIDISQAMLDLSLIHI